MRVYYKHIRDIAHSVQDPVGHGMWRYTRKRPICKCCGQNRPSTDNDKLRWKRTCSKSRIVMVQDDIIPVSLTELGDVLKSITANLKYGGVLYVMWKSIASHLTDPISCLESDDVLSITVQHIRSKNSGLPSGYGDRPPNAPKRIMQK